jgi:DNA-binding GntR family transcriptional regulator
MSMITHLPLAGIPASVSLSDQAVEALRDEILSCRLAPGATVSETLMTERLSLGRAPVRAALARLAEEGLVQAVPRRGWMVSLVTVRDIHEVFDLRMILEPEAARRAAVSGNTARLARLDAVCDQGYTPEDPDSARRFLAANRAFGRLLDESARMLVLGLSVRDRSGEMAHEHGALIAALAARDGERAGAIMREQVAASRDMVLVALTGPNSSLVVSEVA